MKESEYKVYISPFLIQKFDIGPYDHDFLDKKLSNYAELMVKIGLIRRDKDNAFKRFWSYINSLSEKLFMFFYWRLYLRDCRDKQYRKEWGENCILYLRWRAKEYGEENAWTKMRDDAESKKQK